MRLSEDRQAATTGWNIWRVVIGLLYLAAAAFNLAYTLPRTDEPDVFEGYADGAWLPLLEDIVRDVLMPNGQVLIAVVIFFEVAVGIAILSRGVWVDAGVIASQLWVFGILPFLAWPYLLTNVALLAMQGVVLLRTYERPIWPDWPPRRQRQPRSSRHVSLEVKKCS